MENKIYLEDAEVKVPHIKEELVDLSHLFNDGREIYFQRHHTTFDRWIEYCAAVGKEIPYDEDWGMGNRPVINITPIEMCEYINWLNETIGEWPNKKGEMVKLTYRYIINGTTISVENPGAPGFRLPSEQMWIKAAGPVPEDIDNYAWHYNNSNRRTQPAATKKPNENGLYDMFGNVWDTVQDV